MGGKCYEQSFHNDFKDKKVYVATSKEIDDYANTNCVKMIKLVLQMHVII